MSEDQDEQQREDLQRSVAKAIAELSSTERTETPQGVAVTTPDIEAADVRFDDGSWRGSVGAVQGWLQLPGDLDPSSPEKFDASLADALGTPSRATEADLLAALAERLDRATELRERFLDTMEGVSEGDATLETATRAWVTAWDESVEESEEYESASTGPIRAEADTWPIQQFGQFAADGEIDLAPSYQRADVWPTTDAQMLIESVLRGIPLPSIIILQRLENGRVIYEVVDGKQRLTSILRFIGAHPIALETIEKKKDEWGEPYLRTIFTEDYPAFKKLWRKYEMENLTAQTERKNYFPFPLRKGDVKALSGELEPLRGKYYSEIRSKTITVVGDPRPVKFVFEQAATYKIPVITYKDATDEQIHEVFSLYNKQGKHLNAEEIRNALYHHLDLMRALLVTAGDADDVEVVAPFLAAYDDEWSSTGETLTKSYGFGKAGYKRTKLLSWIASVLLFDGGRPESRSTAGWIDSFLRRVSEDRHDVLRDDETVAAAMILLRRGLDAHAGLDPDVWVPFRNATGQKWQELQLVASLIAFCAAYLILDDELEEVAEDASETIRERSAGWRRPEKTQSREQWRFIAMVVENLLEILGVDGVEADRALRERFGSSGLGTLLGLNTVDV
ncbi:MULTISPECIES: DUF262 domain-containing protein [Mumia]|nr:MULTISPECIES: DUF262 domain-containing protein [Mumia]